MLTKVYSKAPAPRHIDQIVQVLQEDGLVILPTDSVYCFAVSAHSKLGRERLAALKGKPVEKANLSFMLSDLTSLGTYAKKVSNPVYALMNRLLPGPFTFILQASAEVEKMMPGRKTIGIRVADHKIPAQIIAELGHPLLTMSVHHEDEILAYATDPEEIYRLFADKADLIVDGGFGHNEASTILDCTGTEVVVIRQGIGALEEMN